MTRATHARDAAAVLLAVAGAAGSSSAQVLLNQSPLTPSFGADSISGTQSELGNPFVRFRSADQITIGPRGANLGLINWWGFQNGSDPQNGLLPFSDPTGSAVITPIDILDPLGPGTSTFDSFEIIIYNNDGADLSNNPGTPGPGTVVASFFDIQPIREITGIDNRQDGTGFGPIETYYSYDLSDVGDGGVEGGQFLDEGTYWIQVANNSAEYRDRTAGFSSNFIAQWNGQSDTAGGGTDGYARTDGNLNITTWLETPGLISGDPGLGEDPPVVTPLNMALRISAVGSGLLADINGDGVVNVVDLAILGSNFGKDQQVLGTGDINGDGVVDEVDLAILGGEFGSSLPAPLAAIPEPGSLALLGLGGLTLIRRRRA